MRYCCLFAYNAQWAYVARIFVWRRHVEMAEAWLHMTGSEMKANIAARIQQRIKIRLTLDSKSKREG